MTLDAYPVAIHLKDAYYTTYGWHDTGTVTILLKYGQNRMNDPSRRCEQRPEIQFYVDETVYILADYRLYAGYIAKPGLNIHKQFTGWVNQTRRKIYIRHR